MLHDGCTTPFTTFCVNVVPITKDPWLIFVIFSYAKLRVKEVVPDSNAHSTRVQSTTAHYVFVVRIETLNIHLCSSGDCSLQGLNFSSLPVVWVTNILYFCYPAVSSIL